MCPLLSPASPVRTYGLVRRIFSGPNEETGEGAMKRERVGGGTKSPLRGAAVKTGADVEMLGAENAAAAERVGRRASDWPEEVQRSRRTSHELCSPFAFYGFIWIQM